MRIFYILITSVWLLVSVDCSKQQQNEATNENKNLERARITLDSLYQNYSVNGSFLFRENYPFDEKYTATYLASEEQAVVPNQYSYLWPYSGTFSAVNAIYEYDKSQTYKDILDSKVLSGLEEYFDTNRQPYGYASYISSAPVSDRFYDDNVWLGIDFTDLYAMTAEQKYLEKAKLIWDFVISGADEKLGGGIYWCEQKKESKNTCSNAPGSVFAFKLFEATKDSAYFQIGKELYEWTKNNLQDPNDFLYYDNIALNGKIGKAKYSYNSGQMMQSAALQYKLTKDPAYLKEAQNLAQACYDYFFTNFIAENGESFRLLKKGDVWFNAVMLRGFIELYHLDNDKIYIDAFNKSLDYAWNNARDDKGLFNVDFSGKSTDTKKWLLTQAAVVEMYARLGQLK